MNSTLRLTYDFLAVLKLAEEGINILENGIPKDVLIQPDKIVTFVWIGMLGDNPDITRDQAKSALKGLKPKQVFDAITEAIQRDLSNGSAEATS